MNKNELRKRMRAQRQKVKPEKRNEDERKVCQRLLKLKEVKQAKNIFIYCSTSEEVGTGQIISKLLELGKRVYLPRVKGAELEMVRVCSDTKFVAGAFGIQEPEGEAEEVKDFVCITPCVAVDKRGNRIGYGGGFYDRFFEAHSCFKVALCFGEQVLEEIECEVHDVKMDKIITEKGVIDCRAAKAHA